MRWRCICCVSRPLFKNHSSSIYRASTVCVGLRAGPLQLERGALAWAEGLSGVRAHGLKSLYDSATGALHLPHQHIQLPPRALAFLQMMIQAGDEQLLQVPGPPAPLKSN